MKFKDGAEWAGKKEVDPDEFDPELLKEFIEECELHLALFNKWEEDFLASVKAQLESGKVLSMRQREIIGNMYEKTQRRRK